MTIEVHARNRGARVWRFSRHLFYLAASRFKEKVLAAHRIGIRQVILPRRNEREAEEVPPEARKEMQFHFVDTAEEVLALALVPLEKDGSRSHLSQRE